MTACLLCQQTIVSQYSLHELCFNRYFYQDLLCRTCRDEFQEIIRPACCQICGRHLNQTHLCRDCLRRQQSSTELLTNQALFRYNTAMHDYFQQYKGRGDYRLRLAFAGSLRRVVQQYQATTLFVPIPTSPNHFEERQFDPVLGLYSDILPLTCLLVCHDHADHQAQLTRHQRLISPQYFYCETPATQKNGIKQILLLDDIYTTGTTLYQGLAALRQAGYRGKMTSLTLAR